MTKEQLAAILTGREIGDEITPQECKLAKASGLLVIFGASDDLTEFRGLFYDEADACDGAEHQITAAGIAKDWDSIDHDDRDEMRNYFKNEGKGVAIEAQWCVEGDYSWTFKTAVPHATFEIIEDGKPYCRGIIIDAKDLPTP